MIAFHTQQHERQQHVNKPSEQLQQLEAVQQVTTEFSPLFLFSLVGVCLYHVVVRKFIEGKKIGLWQATSRIIRMKKKCYNNRRDRYFRCCKRFESKRNNCLSSTSSDRCVVGECLAKFAKIHMPPPLPWRKKKSKKACKDALKNSLPSIPEKRGVPEDKAETTPVVNDLISTVQSVVADFSPFVESPSRSMTALIDLARMQNWDLLLQQATRRGAKYHDMDGLYPLHWAVSGGPPQEVVETLLQVYPSAAHKLDKEGSTPLHFATHYAASPAVVELLLKAFPKAVRLQDFYGRTPLYHAVEKCLAMESLKLLVQADPSVVTLPCLPKEYRDLPITRTTGTMTPLYMVWARVVRERRIGKGTKKQFKPLEKAHFLLEAAFFHLKNVKPSVPRNYCFVSGAIALDLYLPDEIVPMAVEQYPGELSQTDEEGRVPLAQVAASRQYSRERAHSLITLLIESFAEAAMSRDRDGRSPLLLALLSGKTWSAGVSRLFEANPDAIRWTNHGNQLPAFASAACLEAEEVDAASTRLAGEAPNLSLMNRNDPYNLVNSKQRQLLEMAHKRLMGTGGRRDKASSAMNPNSENGDNDEGGESNRGETERLTTVFNLLLSEPSALTLS